MNDVEVKVIDIGDKKYFFVDQIDKYYFWSNVNDKSDCLIFKEDNDNFVALSDKDEFESALILFYRYHQDLVSVNEEV